MKLPNADVYIPFPSNQYPTKIVGEVVKYVGQKSGEPIQYFFDADKNELGFRDTTGSKIFLADRQYSEKWLKDHNLRSIEEFV